MSFDKLDPAIWAHILDFLRPAFPKILSGLSQGESVGMHPQDRALLPEDDAPGVTTRADIRAIELARLMRTSIAFNRLASRPLYRTVITDAFALLVDGIDELPAHPQIQSKRDLLKITRRVHLEYQKKGVRPSYLQIMKDPAHFEATSALGQVHAALMDMRTEADQIGPPFEFRDDSPFRNVTHVTVGAIFGGQADLWRMTPKSPIPSGTQRADYLTNGQPHRLLHDAVLSGQRSMVGWFQTAPIVEWCQRGHGGPLSLPQTFDWTDDVHYLGGPPTKPIFNIHFELDLMKEGPVLPNAIDGETRWLLEEQPPADQYHLLEDTISAAWKTACADRAHHWPKTPAGWENPNRAILNLAIYGSSNGQGPPDARLRGRTEISSMEKFLRIVNDKKAIPRAPEMGVVSWQGSDKSPPCTACGKAFQPPRTARHLKAGGAARACQAMI